MQSGEKAPLKDGSNRTNFDGRLAAAEALLRRSDPLRASKDEGYASPSNEPGLGLAMRMGTELVAAFGVGGAIGYGLDRLLEFRALFLIIFALLGGVAGLINIWQMIRKIGS